VRRVRRSTSSSSLGSTSEESVASAGSTTSTRTGEDGVVEEVKTVRREDGRLVRMVKRLVNRKGKKKEDKKEGPVSKLSPEDEAVAEQYRKMIQMGMPDDAVKHKMTQDDVKREIIESVMKHEASSKDPASSETSGAVGQSSITLTADEEAQANKFRKMLKMGLPEEAVRHKMAAASVDPKIIAAVVGGDAPGGEEEAAPEITLTKEEEGVAERYRKMMRIGLSEVAVRTKMQNEGVDPRIVYSVAGGDPPAAAPVDAGPPGLTDKEKEIVERYQKMLRTGIPEVAVRNKMTAEGLDERMVAMVLEQHASIEFNTAQKLIKQYEDIAKKFQEMLKAGESNEVVRKRMMDEGVSEKLITTVLEGGSLEDLANEEAKAPKFEVEVHQAPEGQAGAVGASNLDPTKQYAEVGEGKEVVDSKLAEAARAVSVLGDLDIQALLSKLQNGDMEILINKLQEAEKRQKKLEKQLAQSGIAIAEDIEYMEAKLKVEEIARRMGEIGGSDATVEDKQEQVKLREEYFKLEQEMERFNTALMLTEEYQAEQDAMEQKWERDNAPANVEALKTIRRHMPVKIRFMSEADLTTQPSPNGKFLPKTIAKKFKRTNVLQCLRVNPDDLERMHPSTLENMRVTGLTLTERRALYLHLKPLERKWEKNKSEKMTERKWTWYKMMKNNFKENLAPYERHIAEFGPPGNHTCTLLGKQCPVKADKVIDYDNDYGYPDTAEYEISEVKKADVDDPGAKAMQEALGLLREKKANERGDLLKKHYKGKLLQVSKANGSCENMDEAMDRMENHTMKWIGTLLEKGDKVVEADQKKEVGLFTDAINELKLSTLDFAQRSGMQLSGKRTAGGDKVDIRSSVEGGLAEEVIECSREFFSYIRKRMGEIGIPDTRITKTIESIEQILGDLHTKNLELLKKLGVPRPNRSRKLKTNSDLKKEVEEKRKQAEDKDKPAAAESTGGARPPGPPMPRGGGGRGGLLDAIQGAKGRGRIGGARGGGGGRGGLLGKFCFHVSRS